eukprot:scaffold11792_cov112-Isochrysis_galbana.AAC.6
MCTGSSKAVESSVVGAECREGAAVSDGRGDAGRGSGIGSPTVPRLAPQFDGRVVKKWSTGFVWRSANEPTYRRRQFHIYVIPDDIWPMVFFKKNL